MAILMVHDEKDHGMVAINEGKVAGEHFPSRHYTHEEHFLVLDHPSNIVMLHDLQELERLGYRTATAEEMNEYKSKQQKKTRITERKKS